MPVLQGLRNWWQEVRIDSAFRKYEAVERLQHNKNLDRRFDTSQIEREIAVSEKSILAAADTKFAAEIHAARSRLTTCEANIKGRNADLITIQRNHESELIALERDISKIRSEIQAIRRQKQRAHTNLNNAQSEVREFHDSNTDFFGNRQHIPQHSFFGKSWSDLDPLVEARQVAAEEVGSLSSSLGSVIDRELHKRDLRSKVYESRNRKRLLVKHRVSIGTLHKAISLLESDRVLLKRDLQTLESARQDFLLSERHSAGLATRTAEVVDLQSRKARLAAAFDNVESEAARRALHRKAWFEKN